VGGGTSFRISRIFTLVTTTAVLTCWLVPKAHGQAVASPGARLSWSLPAISKTIKQDREFHGPFCKEDLTVTCDELGKHDFIEISFDLIVMSSWDGSANLKPDGSLDPIGPDYFRLGIQNGPTLVYHTFSNIPLTSPVPTFTFPNASSKAQSYPSPVPGVRLPPHSGASEFNTLGYAYTDTRPVPFVPMDATYPIKFIIPHSEAKVVLEMNGLHLQNAFDENWGIANLVVRPLAAAQVRRPAADSIEVAFRSSLAKSANDYVEMFQTLISGMDDTAAWINKNVVPGLVNVRRVDELIKALGGGRPDEEAAAVIELRAIGHQTEPYMRDARRTAKPEQREQIDRILEALGITPVNDDSIERVILATRVLEVIGTPKALAVRKKMTSE